MLSMWRRAVPSLLAQPQQQGAYRVALAVRCLSTAPPQTETPSGWFPPQGGNASLGFHVGRTHTNNLPLYRKMTQEGHRVQTKVKHLSGNLQMAAKALSEVTGVPLSKMQVKFTEIVLPGDHMRTVEAWLKEQKF